MALSHPPSDPVPSYPLEGSAAIVADSTHHLANRRGPLHRAHATWTANDGSTPITLAFEPEDAGKYADVRFVSAKAVAGGGSSTSYTIHFAESIETDPDGILARYASSSTAVGSTVEDGFGVHGLFKLDSNGAMKLWCIPDASTTDGEIYVDARIVE